MKWIASLITGIFLVSCAPLWAGPNHGEAIGPSADKSDLIFVRTGDRLHYYVMDSKRKICFFHSRLYGKRHMVEIACDKIPEAQAFLGTSVAKAAQTKGQKHDSDSTLMKEAPKKIESREPNTPAPRNKPLSNADRANYKRVYVQYFCARKAGNNPELDVILARHGLTRDAYGQLKTEFGKDKILWSGITTELAKVCP
ncbi:MAG TPA: hypothetical protein EYN66_10120 [Myxococcales bacterium]|nr:hypothetical protein [Myxococcales bacterium]